jgi:hypothetical protein
MEREKKALDEYREIELKKAKEADALFAADLDRESKKKATIQAEMTRRELEAELGSARAIAIIEAENRRRLEEALLEKDKSLDLDSQREGKRRIFGEAWERWSGLFIARAVKDETDGAIREDLTDIAEGGGVEEIDSLRKSYLPFKIRKQETHRPRSSAQLAYHTLLPIFCEEY